MISPRGSGLANLFSVPRNLFPKKKDECWKHAYAVMTTAVDPFTEVNKDSTNSNNEVGVHGHVFLLFFDAGPLVELILPRQRADLPRRSWRLVATGSARSPTVKKFYKIYCFQFFSCRLVVATRYSS